LDWTPQAVFVLLLLLGKIIEINAFVCAVDESIHDGTSFEIAIPQLLFDRMSELHCEDPISQIASSHH
jgi:hypothetical protein